MGIRVQVPLPGPFVWTPGRGSGGGSGGLFVGLGLAAVVMILPVIALYWAIVGPWRVHWALGVLVNLVELALLVPDCAVPHRSASGEAASG